MIPGRSCPLHYRHDPADLAGTVPLLQTDVLLVAGGLYGNPEALDAIEEMARREGAPLLFNGDFHWFDADAAAFRDIQARVLGHAATAGNVEREIAEASGAGCGCAYPPEVDDATVERSNLIMQRLQNVTTIAEREALTALPDRLVAAVGDRRVGIVHGDAESLAGWALAADRVDETAAEGRLAAWFRAANVDAFACTHTCLPHARTIEIDGKLRGVINNGSAGMPNFGGDPRPLITRIASRPSPRALYRVELDGLVLEALAVEIDHDAWVTRFHDWWPAGSPARLSYEQRIMGGPAFTIGQAIGPGAQPIAA